MDLEKMVDENMGLVHKVAQKYSYMLDYNYHYDYGDIVQEGIVGLINAIQGFDESLGYKFSTYAMYLIEQRVQMFLGNHGTNLYFGRHVIYYASKITKAGLKDADVKTIMEKTGLNECKVLGGLAYINNKPCVYLDNKSDASDENSSTYHNVVFKHNVDFDKNIIMAEFYSKLKESEQIVFYYLLNDYKQRDIAEILNVSRQMVGIHVKSIRKKYNIYKSGGYLKCE